MNDAAPGLNTDVSKTAVLIKTIPHDTLQAQDDMPSVALIQESLTEYEVTIHTADVQGAGTDADVSLIMIGTSGDDDKLHGCWPSVNDIALRWCQARLH